MQHRSGIKAQLVCILILSLVGWATSAGYGMLRADISVGAFDEAYRLPDGSFASICSEIGQHQKETGDRHCDQCVPSTLVAAFLPDVDMWLPANIWHAGVSQPLRPQLTEMLSLDRATSRGPPVMV